MGLGSLWSCFSYSVGEGDWIFDRRFLHSYDQDHRCWHFLLPSTLDHYASTGLFPRPMSVLLLVLDHRLVASLMERSLIEVGSHMIRLYEKSLSLLTLFSQKFALFSCFHDWQPSLHRDGRIFSSGSRFHGWLSFWSNPRYWAQLPADRLITRVYWMQTGLQIVAASGLGSAIIWVSAL